MYNPFHANEYAWCQTSSIASHIRNIINQNQRIVLHNPYQKRYNKNNDLFIHVRLGDIVEHQFHLEYEYYDRAIQTIYESDAYRNNVHSNNVSYITSDSINHEICQRLIQKYQLVISDRDEIDTLQFGSTCQHILLSQGTFSWLIGLVSFYSHVYYPKMKVKWHGNIFVFPDWHSLESN